MNHEQLREIYEDPNTTHQECVEASIKAFQNYMNTYEYPTCSGNGNVFIEDVLYMIGVALYPNKYSFFDGYSQFKRDLILKLTEGEHFEFKKEIK